MDRITASFALNQSNVSLLNFIDYEKPVPAGAAKVAVPDDKIANFIRATIDLKKLAASEHTSDVFGAALEQLRTLSRIAELESGWIVYPLYRCALQLFQLAAALDSEKRLTGRDQPKLTATGHQAQQQPKVGDLKTENFLTQCGRAIHMTLSMCLKDRDPSPSNKRSGSYYFSILLFRIYYRLRAHGLITNLVKVLESRAHDLTPVTQAFGDRRAFTATYCYYMGRYYMCRKGDQQKAFDWLYTAYRECRSSYYRQQQQIKILLFPAAFLAHRIHPHTDELERWDLNATRVDYKAIFSAVLGGNVAALDRMLETEQQQLLSRDLYLPLSQLRPYAVLRLVRAAWAASGRGWQVPTRLIACAVERAVPRIEYDEGKEGSDGKTEDLLDHTECLVAGMIARGFVRGYLSHGNRVLVVSKTEPFPRLGRSSEALKKKTYVFPTDCGGKNNESSYARALQWPKGYEHD